MAVRELSTERQALLLRAYPAYNAQDLERLLTLVSDDVDWPDVAAGRLDGRQALSAYWTEQWKRVRAHDHSLAFEDQNDGRVAVYVRQVVRALDGSRDLPLAPLASRHLRHCGAASKLG